MKKTESLLRTLRRTLLLCLCITLLAGSALANEVVDISTDGYDCLYYRGQLPDGRVLFSGWKGTVGNYEDSRARIICLNPDMTVSWEFIDPEEGSCGFYALTVLKDGTIAALLDNSPYQKSESQKLKYFTPDGKPTGKEIDIQETLLMDGTSPSCMWVLSTSDDGDETSMAVYDWEGNMLFRDTEGHNVISGARQMIEEEDGLVFAGNESGLRTCARIAKVDFQGNLLWETVLPLMLEGAEEGSLKDFMKAEDGGYLALLYECGPADPNGLTAISSYAVVKFSSNGRLLWKNTKPFEGKTDIWVGRLAMYNGKLVTEIERLHNTNNSVSEPHTFLWMDQEGNELGTTELIVKQAELPRHADLKKVYTLGFGRLIPTENGLWGLESICQDNRDHIKAQDNTDDLLIRIPEL